MLGSIQMVLLVAFGASRAINAGQQEVNAAELQHIHLPSSQDGVNGVKK